jgi:hypothetical protein
MLQLLLQGLQAALLLHMLGVLLRSLSCCSHAASLAHLKSAQYQAPLLSLGVSALC